MSKYLSFVLIIIFVVGTVAGAIFSENGLGKDAKDTLDNSQKIIQDANDSIGDLGN